MPHSFFQVSKLRIIILTFFLYCYFIAGVDCLNPTFTDTCDSLGNSGLRKSTENITIDTNGVNGFDGDTTLFTRNTDNTGSIVYESDKGFQGIYIVGFVYDTGSGDDDWYLDVYAGSSESSLERILDYDSESIEMYEARWEQSMPAWMGSWKKFIINKTDFEKTLTPYPTVLKILLRGYASTDIYPGWGIQIGEIRLTEDLFGGYKTPECICNAKSISFEDLKNQPVMKIEDKADSFEHVFKASKNILIEKEDIMKVYDGDSSRFSRKDKKKGTITYNIPKGIISIEVVTYTCVPNNLTISVVPYMNETCKPPILMLNIKYDTLSSECWHRRVLSINFIQFLRYVPTYVDILIEGEEKGNSTQISSIILKSYGKTNQDSAFHKELKDNDRVKKMSNPKVDNMGEKISSVTVTEISETLQTQEEGDNDSVQYWLIPLTIAFCLLLLGVLLFLGIRIAQNSETFDFEVFVSKVFKKFTRNSTVSGEPSLSHTNNRGIRNMPSGVSPSVAPSINTLVFMNNNTDYVNSVTFDDGVKTNQERTGAVGFNLRPGAVEDQLVDLSQVLHKSMWTSKIVRKHQVLVIEEMIGKGGFGQVWRARWQGTPVAMKVLPIPGQLSGEEKLSRMAIMEAALSGCLAHPNIVSTYTVEIREVEPKEAKEKFDFFKMRSGTTGVSVDTAGKWMRWDQFTQSGASKSFLKCKNKENYLELRIIMEYCDKGSLYEAIRNGWFKDGNNTIMEHVLQTALDIARGLWCLHENTIIHGDLKPHNVLLQNKPFVDTRGFVAKIADFGLSVKMEDEQNHVAGCKMGTGGYVSPEVVTYGKLLPASDVYSFGILLWEMYTGKPIHEAMKNAPLTSRSLGQWRPTFPQSCPKAYASLAISCWNDFPDWRPTFDRIIEELTSLLERI